MLLIAITKNKALAFVYKCKRKQLPIIAILIIVIAIPLNEAINNYAQAANAAQQRFLDLLGRNNVLQNEVSLLRTPNVGLQQSNQKLQTQMNTSAYAASTPQQRTPSTPQYFTP